jgi:hypothetical protein
MTAGKRRAWYRRSRQPHPARFWTIFLCMTNRFGALLNPDEMRWAAAEGVCEGVIAAVLLLHERSVEQIVAELSPAELEQVIKLVGRSPRVSTWHARCAQTAESYGFSGAGREHR